MARNGKQGGGQRGGQPNGGKQPCGICQKNGHSTADCYQNPNNKNKNGKGKGQQKQSGQGQQQGQSSKWCSNCNMKNHNTEDCSRGPKNPQSQPQSPNQTSSQPQSPNQGYQQQQQPQIPNINGVPIVFNDPCQLCSQRGHIARDCPSRHSYIPPQSGSYFPQTYPPPATVPAYTPPQQQWSGALQQQQQFSQGPEMVGEEVSTRDQRSGYQAYQGHVPEIAVHRERNQDRDGDFVMEDAW